MELRPFDPKRDIQEQIEETREYRRQHEKSTGCAGPLFMGFLVLLTIMLFSLRSGCVYG